MRIKHWTGLGKKGLWRQHANIATSLKQNNPKKNQSVLRGRGRALPSRRQVQRLPFNHHFCRWGFLCVCPFHWLISFIIILLLLTFFSFFSFFFLLLITLKNKIHTLVKHPAFSRALLEIIKKQPKKTNNPPPKKTEKKKKTHPKIQNKRAWETKK